MPGRRLGRCLGRRRSAPSFGSLRLPLDMVDVVRLFRHGGESPCTVCRPFSVLGGSLEWEVLPPSLDTFLLLAVSKFGDLGTYSSLSQASCLHGRHLAASLRYLGVTAGRIDDARRRDACHVCGKLGLARGLASECGNCDEVACEDCVALASFSRKRSRDLLGLTADQLALYRPQIWICVWCARRGKAYVDFPTVPSPKTWVCDEAAEVAYRVIVDYDFPFWLRLVSLSGEEVRDEEGRLRGMVCTRWIMDFEVLWRWIMGSTGGRALQFVLGGTVVDSTSLRGAKWPQFLSRSQAKACTESSPLVVTVVLRGWS